MPVRTGFHRLVVATTLVASAALLGYANFHRWEVPPDMVTSRQDWPNAPLMQNSDNFNVLTSLLHEDREEIRFYQDKLFTISFLFSAGVLGLAGFWLKLKNDSFWLRVGIAATCLVFCFFYFRFVRFANEAIAVNDDDLIGIQFALGLHQEGRYLTGRPIYLEPERNPKTNRHELLGHPHFRPLVLFNSWLVVGTVGLLLLLPVQAEDVKCSSDSS